MTPQEQTDARHLKLLSVFHFVLAGLYFLGIGFLVLHFFMMKTIMTMAENAPVEPGAPPPDMEQIMPILAWLYGGLGLIVLLLVIANVLVGIFLRAPRNRLFTLMVAGVNCLNMPLGTVLGVFTFIVLFRESVVATYRHRP